MNVYDAQNECLSLLAKAIAGLEELHATMKPMAETFAYFQIQLEAFASGERPDSYKEAIRYAGAALHVYLRKFDGSKELVDGIGANTVGRPKTFEDYIAYVAQLGKIASPNFRPVCVILESAMRKLADLGGNSVRLSNNRQEMKHVFNVFTPVESALKEIRLTLSDLNVIHGELRRQCPDVVFANPVYRVIIDHVVPAAALLVDGVLNRGKDVHNLSVLSVEMRSIMSYDGLLTGIDSSACFYLMDLLSFNTLLKSFAVNNLTESSKNFLRSLLRILSTLIEASEFYELTLKPARVFAFELLGSEVARYEDFRAMREIMESLGRVNGCMETKIVFASETAKNNERISKLSVIVRNLPHLRGSSAELGAESRNAAYILWTTFTGWLRHLIEQRDRRLRLEREDAMELDAPNGTSTLTGISTSQTCWINSFLCA